MVVSKLSYIHGKPNHKTAPAEMIAIFNLITIDMAVFSQMQPLIIPAQTFTPVSVGKTTVLENGLYLHLMS